MAEGRSQTRVGNGLDAGDSGIRVIPLRESGIDVSWSVPASEAPVAILRGVWLISWKSGSSSFVTSTTKVDVAAENKLAYTPRKTK